MRASLCNKCQKRFPFLLLPILHTLRGSLSSALGAACHVRF